MSNNMKELIRDIYRTRGDKDESKLFLRKTHDIHPFDDIGKLEHMANKYDSALFILGNTQKKRPENLIFGRMYAEHVLDMIEFGIQNYKSIDSYKNTTVSAVVKPILIFQGE